jgi:hypothetical protein
VSSRITETPTLTKKKDRTKSDVEGDLSTNFFEQIVSDCFSNPQYHVGMPPSQFYDDFPEDEKGNWDPNDSQIFNNTRDGKWLRSTWEEYVRPKYKKALDRWNKNTGGGDGTPVSFINYCAGDRWLVWVYCVDSTANFLLANSAGGRMPRHMQLEAGFEEEIDSSVTGSESTPGGAAAASSKKKARLEQELDAVHQQRVDLSKAITRVTDLLEKRSDVAKVGESADACLRRVAEYSKMMGDEQVLESMSPPSQKLYVESLKKERKNLLEKMNSSSTSNNN